MTALYIDADACPVKAEAERVATRHKVHMYVVSNGGLRPSPNPLVEHVIVAEGPDVAGGKGFTKADRSRFLDGLERALRKAAQPP